MDYNRFVSVCSRTMLVQLLLSSSSSLLLLMISLRMTRQIQHLDIDKCKVMLDFQLKNICLVHSDCSNMMNRFFHYKFGPSTMANNHKWNSLDLRCKYHFHKGYLHMNFVFDCKLSMKLCHQHIDINNRRVVSVQLRKYLDHKDYVNMDLKKLIFSFTKKISFS